MEGKIVQRADAFILGVQKRLNPMASDWPALWQSEFGPRMPEIAALSGEPVSYGVFFPTNEPDMADYLAGMIVPVGVAVPAGMTLRPLPGGAYARFDCTLETLGATWGGIYSQWLPASPYVEDASRPAMECYAMDASTDQSAAQVFVPIKEK